jgi:hypothetical protein
MMATLFGMALGGWMSGAIFDLTGSYRAAFGNGVAWNFANAMIVLWLLWNAARHAAPAEFGSEANPRGAPSRAT